MLGCCIAKKKVTSLTSENVVKSTLNISILNSVYSNRRFSIIKYMFLQANILTTFTIEVTSLISKVTNAMKMQIQ